MNSAIYAGRVVHARLRPKRHRLSYRVFALLLDLDEIDDLASRLRLFAYNRAAVFSFHDKDHGSGEGRLRERDMTVAITGRSTGPAKRAVVCLDVDNQSVMLGTVRRVTLENRALGTGAA